MTVTCVPDVQPFVVPPIETIPPVETLPKRQGGGWMPDPEPRVGLDLGSDDELLLLENKTGVSWVIYHDFHQLGIVDPGEMLIFHLCKHGSLSARPCASNDSVEYLVLPLKYDINQVHIYRRKMAKDFEVYDMGSFSGLLL